MIDHVPHALSSDALIDCIGHPAARLLLDGLPVGLCAIDRDGMIVFANALVRRILSSGTVGFGTLDGPIVWERILSRSRIRKHWPIAAGLSGRAVDGVHLVFREDEQSWRIFSVDGAPLDGRSRSGVSLLLFTDVTASEVARVAAKEREHQVQAMITVSLDALAVSTDVIVEVNERFCAMFGYEREEAIGMPPSLFHPPLFGAFAASAWSTNETDEEVPCLRQDGTRFLAMISGLVLDSPGGPLRVTAFRDLTPVKHLEEDVRRLQSAFEELLQRTAELSAINRDIERRFRHTCESDRLTAALHVQIVALEKSAGDGRRRHTE